MFSEFAFSCVRAAAGLFFKGASFASQIVCSRKIWQIIGLVQRKADAIANHQSIW